MQTERCSLDLWQLLLPTNFPSFCIYITMTKQSIHISPRSLVNLLQYMLTSANYRCSETVAPPGFCNRGEVRYGSIGGLEYEVPQSRLYCLCINVALCTTALQCICRVIRRSSMTMKAHTYYIIFGRPPMGGRFPPGGATVQKCASGNRASKSHLNNDVTNPSVKTYNHHR